MSEPQGTLPSLKNLLLTAVFYVLFYYCGGILGDWISVKGTDFPAFWPPCGLCLAVLMLHPKRTWPLFLGATLIGSILIETSVRQHGIWIGLGEGVSLFLQGALGAWLIRRFTGPDFTLDHLRNVVFLVVISIGTSLLNAALLSLTIGLSLGWKPVSQHWLLWWLADMIGILVVTPVVLSWAKWTENKLSLNVKQACEAAALFSSLLLASDIVFGPIRSCYFDLTFPYTYILLPFLLWSAFRFAPPITASASLLLAVIASFYTVNDCGPFDIGHFTQFGHLLFLQIFVGVAALFSLFPGPIISERRRALERVSDLNATLERRVQKRTAALEESEQRYRLLSNEQDSRIRERTEELSMLNDELQSAILIREKITHMLEESTAMQRAILDSANASIISTEPNGMIRTVNATALRWLNFPEEELIGKCNLYTLHDPIEIRTRFRLLGEPDEKIEFEALVACVKNKNESEWAYLRKDGSRFPISLSVTALHDEKGILTGYLHIARDITERKQAEKALHESESNLRSFFNSASIMMGIIEITDTDMIHVSDNAASARFYRMTPESMRGRRAVDIGVPQWIIEIWTKNSRRSERTGYPVKFEYAHRIHDVTHQLSVTLAFTAVTPLGHARFSYIAEDVSDRKRSQEALQRFAAILEATTDFVAIADKSGRTLFLNKAGRKMIGWGENEDITKFNLSSFHPNTAWELIQREGIPSAIREDVWQAETAILNRSTQNEIPVSQVILSHKSTDGSVEFISTIIRDITERKLAEEKIRSSLQEKEILLKEIHHRVKNNMQVVSSILQLQSGYIQDPVALAMFQECRDRIQSMALIHERLYQSSDLAQIDFAEYIRSLVSMLISSHRPTGFDLRSEVNIKSISLDLDTAIPIGLIVNELVINALKYAFKGLSQGEIKVGLKLVDDLSYELEISDNGGGIPEGFDISKATSLGLRLVKILSKQIQGTLSVANENGAHFRVKFNKPKTK